MKYQFEMKKEHQSLSEKIIISIIKKTENKMFFGIFSMASLVGIEPTTNP